MRIRCAFGWRYDDPPPTASHGARTRFKRFAIGQIMSAKRQPFVTRKIRLVGEMQREALIALARNLPIDPQKPLEAVFREEVKARKLDQNALMWVGPLADISEQAWISGRRLTDKGWHEIFKRLYLPEEFDAKLCKEGYQKWDYDENGEPLLIGSTTDLTIKGFALYLEQVYAHGANMGVEFRANPNDARRAA
jgi:hypothetical protein